MGLTRAILALALRARCARPKSHPAILSNPVREFFLALAFHHRDNVGMLIPIRSDAVVRFPSHMAITVKARAFLLSEYLLELRNSPWSPTRSCGQAGPSSPDIFERDLPNVDFQRSRGNRISELASSGRVNASRMWTRIAIAERDFAINC